MASSSSRKVIYAALIGNFLIAITKFIAAGVSGSSAMLSEGIHSIVDTGNQGLLLYGIRRSKKSPTPAFPFGYGKEIYFWAFVVAILIFAVGAGVSIIEGLRHILHPKPLGDARINYLVLGFAFVIEGIAWCFAFREFKHQKGKWGYIEAVQRGKDPSMFVVLFEDSAAILGLGVAFLGIALSQLTRNPVYDGVASVLIGIILGGTAMWLAYETKGLLIGESANPEVVRGIRETILPSPIVETVNEILTMHVGPEFILVNISVDFKNTVSADELESAISEFDAQIKTRYPEVKRIFVEAEARRGKSPPLPKPNRGTN